MYLSEEKCAEIWKCFENECSNSELNSRKYKETHLKGVHDTAGIRSVSQNLFEARNGKEVFIPFFDKYIIESLII